MVSAPLLALLLLIGSAFVDASVIRVDEVDAFSAKSVLDGHVDIFRKAIESGDKDILKSLMPVNQENSDALLDQLIAAHKTVSMEVDSGHSIESNQIGGSVFYSKLEGPKVEVRVVIQKDKESASGYRFVSLESSQQVEGRRNFPTTCLIGFIWCYLYLIDIFPPKIEQIFGAD